MRNIFKLIPQNLQDEVFEVLVNSEQVSIERIVSYGHSSAQGEWLCQQKNEWVIILKGEAKLLLEGQTPIKMIVGDFLSIPAHTKHRVDWTSPNEETIWLAVHYE